MGMPNLLVRPMLTQFACVFNNQTLVWRSIGTSVHECMDMYVHVNMRQCCVIGWNSGIAGVSIDERLFHVCVHASVSVWAEVSELSRWSTTGPLYTKPAKALGSVKRHCTTHDTARWSIISPHVITILDVHDLQLVNKYDLNFVYLSPTYFTDN